MIKQINVKFKEERIRDVLRLRYGKRKNISTNRLIELALEEIMQLPMPSTEKEEIPSLPQPKTEPEIEFVLDEEEDEEPPMDEPVQEEEVEEVQAPTPKRKRSTKAVEVPVTKAAPIAPKKKGRMNRKQMKR